MSEIKIKLTDKQREAWKYLTRDEETEIVLYGGIANSGKSWLAAVWILTHALSYPGIRIGLCRKDLGSLKKTSLKTFYDAAKMYGLKKGVDFILNNQTNIINFKNGSEIYLINLAWKPSDIDADFLGGYELSLAVIDEVPEIDQTYFETLYSRIRYKLDEFGLSKKLLCTCNPSNGWVKSYFYDRWVKNKLPNQIKFVSAVGGHNPYRGKDYAKKLSLMSESKLRRLEYGDWEYASTPDQLFNNDKLERILTGLILGNINKHYITIDVARFGQDNTVICVWEGMRIIKIVKLSQSSIDNTAKEVTTLMNEYKISRADVIADSDGVGGGLVDILKCKAFVNNAKPFKNEKYDNMKSQMYFRLVKEDWSIATNIKDEYLEQIKKELSAIRDTSDENKYSINSKDEQKKLLGNSSPDFADSIMMRMYFLYTSGSVILDAV